ncbi:MAG: phospho-sugar mutase, partial [Flammeovirgaceae bacterium]|nr:phospho-sugar mutase [Flammeovirgaceae bacterium]
MVITASHNPKEYNGYKAYWNDGAQLIPPHDVNIIEEVNSIDQFDQINFEGDQNRIRVIGKEIDEAYYEEILKLIPNKDRIEKQNTIPIVYSSLHGAGITMVPECLRRIGFQNIIIVEEQAVPDGNFPTVKSPNPEEKETMAMAMEKAKKENAELVMATDPDTDRVGIGIRDNHGNYFLINGNQGLSLMMWFILKNLKGYANPYIVKTIVTTELVDAMAIELGVACINTLTGFKYIADVMNRHNGEFVAAGEESYGYIVGDFVRDKDAVSACAFFAAMAACARDEGKSLYDWLIEMYCEFGFY